MAEGSSSLLDLFTAIADPRVERNRKYSLLDIVALTVYEVARFPRLKRFAGARSIGMVKATRETTAGRSTERRYYVSSFSLDAKRFAHAVRTHWSVEKGLHRTLERPSAKTI